MWIHFAAWSFTYAWVARTEVQWASERFKGPISVLNRDAALSLGGLPSQNSASIEQVPMLTQAPYQGLLRASCWFNVGYTHIQQPLCQSTLCGCFSVLHMLPQGLELQRLYMIHFVFQLKQNKTFHWADWGRYSPARTAWASRTLSWWAGWGQHSHSQTTLTSRGMGSLGPSAVTSCCKSNAL